MSRVKIDIFCHILPQAYFDRMTSISTRGAHLQKRVREIPAMTNQTERRCMKASPSLHGCARTADTAY